MTLRLHRHHDHHLCRSDTRQLETVLDTLRAAIRCTDFHLQTEYVKTAETTLETFLMTEGDPRELH